MATTSDSGPKLRRHATPLAVLPPHLRKHKNSYQQRWENTFGKDHVPRWHPQSVVELVRKEGRTMSLLVAIGVCASLLDYVVEEAVVGIGEARKRLQSIDILSHSAPAKLASWTAFTAVVAFLAMLWTRLVDPVAAGSGIPEMKTIISSDQQKDADHFLGRRTLVSKAAGLALALGSGISVGKEGPFVHTASIITHGLMKHIGVFQSIFNNDVLRRHMYNAACAVGVASTFRAPIGGVLFAIEVTSTVFMVTNYWRAFVAAISASLARQFVRMINETEVTAFHPLFPTSFPIKAFSYPEFAAFGFLGVVMGFAGAAYVTASGGFKRWWKKRTARFPWLASCVLLMVTCCLIYIPGPFGRLSFARTISDLCSPSKLSESWTRDESGLPTLLLLPIAAITRLVATVFSTTLPLPAGDFIPTFAAGTAIGRFYGEVLVRCFPDSGIIPGGYALVGGAAFVGSATHTVSVAVIAVEFTGQFVYMTPLIVAVLLASGIGSAMSVSLYESVIISRGLTYLPLLRVNQLNGMKASDVMASEAPFIPMETTLNHIRRVLECHKNVSSFPVVDSLDSMIFYGCVTRTAIERLVESTVEEVPTPLSLTEDEIGPTIKATETRETTTTTALSPVNSLRPTTSVRELNLNHFQSITIDSSVLQLDGDAPVQNAHLLFEMMKLSAIWVTSRGRLVGWIQRETLPARVMELRRKSEENVLVV